MYFWSTFTKVLIAHTEWLPRACETKSPVQYEVGGHCSAHDQGM